MHSSILVSLERSLAQYQTTLLHLSPPGVPQLLQVAHTLSRDMSHGVGLKAVEELEADRNIGNAAFQVHG